MAAYYSRFMPAVLSGRRDLRGDARQCAAMPPFRHFSWSPRTAGTPATDAVPAATKMAIQQNSAKPLLVMPARAHLVPASSIPARRARRMRKRLIIPRAKPITCDTNGTMAVKPQIAEATANPSVLLRTSARGATPAGSVSAVGCSDETGVTVTGIGLAYGIGVRSFIGQRPNPSRPRLTLLKRTIPKPAARWLWAGDCGSRANPLQCGPQRASN
jgi:hypothetical protein